MGARIEFRGNILFRWSADRLDSVVLPDCQTKANYKGHQNVATVHRAGVTILRAGQAPQYAFLPPGYTASLGSGASAEFPVGVSEHLPKLIPSGAFNPTAAAATFHVLGDGLWSITPEPTGCFEYLGQRRSLALALTFESFSSQVDLPNIPTQPNPVTLRDGDTAIIYSFEVTAAHQATKAHLYATHQPTNNSPFDDDFLWMYNLYNGALPISIHPLVPKYTDGAFFAALKGGFMPGVSTCFPAGGG